MARMPAKGPSPTTLIQMRAQISVSTLRTVSRKRRVTKRKTQLGDDVVRRQEAERQGKRRGQQRAEERDGERLRQRPEIDLKLRERAEGRGHHQLDELPEAAHAVGDANPGDVEDREPAEKHGQQRRDRADHDDRDGHDLA